MDGEVITSAATFWGWRDTVWGWQTLISGSFAVFASLLAAWLLLRQIHQTAQHETDRLHRRDFAVRSIMPVTLSLTTKYASDCFEQLKFLFTQLLGQTLNRNVVGYNPPDLPLSLIQNMRDCIESTESAAVRVRLADIISTIQLIDVRMHGIANRGYIDLRVNLISYAQDIASLYALTTSMYEYARRETNILPLYDFTQLRNATRSLYFVDQAGNGDDIHGPNYPDVLANINRQEANNGSPFAFTSVMPTKLRWYGNILISIAKQLENFASR